MIETTGLADPAPVAQTFFVDEEIGRRAALDAIVTVVDALHIRDRLADSHEAQEQIAFADVILLNKVDLLPAADLDRLEAQIRAMNPTATVHRTERCDIALEAVLDRSAFDLERILRIEPAFLLEDQHGHDSAITSLSLASPRPLDERRFGAWLPTIVQTFGADLLRFKGIVAFTGQERRFVLQGVHMLLEGDYQQPWPAGDARESRVVFIGRNLDRDALQRGFQTCVA